jgi:hypothetical protein
MLGQKQSLASPGIRTLDRPLYSLVTVKTTLSGLQSLQDDQKVSMHLMITIHVFLSSLLGSI